MARIILAASTEAVLERYRGALTAPGHTVLSCLDAASVLEQLARGRAADLLLVEQGLAGGGEAQICAALSKRNTSRLLPLVLIVGELPEASPPSRSAPCEMDDFIQAAASAEEIRARVEFNLRSKRVAAEFRRHNSELEIKVVEHTRKVAALVDELRGERDTLRETMNLIEDGVLLLDGTGAVLLENTAGRRLRGGTGEQTGVPASVDPGLTTLARQATSAGCRIELGLSRDGRQFVVAAHPTGDRALLHVRDVTDDRDQELRRLQSEKLASIGLLAAGVAHEINNPASFVLHNIDSVLSLLQTLDEKLAAQPQVARRLGGQALMFESMSILQESKEGMARIARIVRDLHSFSRVDDDTQIATDVNAAVESALSMLRNELRYRATVVRDLRATHPAPGGPARLGQVFLNLVLNAAHALAGGGPDRNRLWVRSYDDGESVVVEVEDNGPGIPPEVMPRIFESFFTTKPRGVGTGLGLPICRDILRSLGGEVTAESEAGRGAMFRVRLPHLTPQASVPAKPPEVRTGRRRRVLAVDDETLLLKAYRRMLIDHHDVELRAGGKEALALLAEDRDFDVILCDLQMPGMSGSEFYGHVKQSYPELCDRFLFITGGAFAPEARRFLDESPCLCINKPFQLEELLASIDHLSKDLPARRGPVARRLPGFADSAEVGH